MAELNALKNQLKEQNQRLLQVTQEKARIEAKNKVSQQKVEDGRGKFAYIFSHFLVDSSNVAFPFLVLLVIEPYENRLRFSWYLFLLTASKVWFQKVE